VEDEYKLLTGAWLDAIGTIISAIAEVRELAGFNDLNNKLVAIGEGLQAVGTLLIGTVATEDPLGFSGEWIDGAGAAASALGACLQDVDPENGEEGVRLETIGNAFQSMGAAISALADHLAGEEEYALGNAVQALGAGLEAVAGVYELNERGEEGQPIATIGAIIQAIGSNLNAIIATRDFMTEN
jgi:hypothetical protein